MSDEKLSDIPSSQAPSDEDTHNLLTPKTATPFITESEPSRSPHRLTDFDTLKASRNYYRKTEVERLNVDTIAFNPDVLNSGKRLLHSQKTLYMNESSDNDSDKVRQQLTEEFEKDRLIDEEVSL